MKNQNEEVVKQVKCPHCGYVQSSGILPGYRTVNGFECMNKGCNRTFYSRKEN